MLIASWNVNSIRARLERRDRLARIDPPGCPLSAGDEGRRRAVPARAVHGSRLRGRRPRTEDLQRRRHSLPGADRGACERVRRRRGRGRSAAPRRHRAGRPHPLGLRSERTDRGQRGVRGQAALARPLACLAASPSSPRRSRRGLRRFQRGPRRARRPRPGVLANSGALPPHGARGACRPLRVRAGGHLPAAPPSPAALYSWWDYRQLAFPKNLGLRIDLILASRGLAASCTAAAIDRQARKGKGASDHTPVLATFEI